MRTLRERRIVAFLAAGGINASQIADIALIPRSTVRDWLVQPQPCAGAMQAVMPENRVLIQKKQCNMVEIGSSSKRWPLLFPQHGPGLKHKRRIVLEPWQEEIVDRHPHEFLRGLIHSDGCRVLNVVNGKAYPRYFFSQVSDDIRGLFCKTCDRVGIAHRHSNRTIVSIARAPSVALLDSFVGPKT